MIMGRSEIPVLIATRPVDFRKQMDGLAALVKEGLGADPFSGAIYVRAGLGNLHRTIGGVSA